jgi:hypothetical protein
MTPTRIFPTRSDSSTDTCSGWDSSTVSSSRTNHSPSTGGQSRQLFTRAGVSGWIAPRVGPARLDVVAVLDVQPEALARPEVSREPESREVPELERDRSLDPVRSVRREEHRDPLALRHAPIGAADDQRARFER